ncbi:hypothetical protein VTI74DRAFT_8741 [Chaetomium olivicolor]
MSQSCSGFLRGGFEGFSGSYAPQWVPFASARTSAGVLSALRKRRPSSLFCRAPPLGPTTPLGPCVPTSAVPRPDSQHCRRQHSSVSHGPESVNQLGSAVSSKLWRTPLWLPTAPTEPHRGFRSILPRPSRKRNRVPENTRQQWAPSSCLSSTRSCKRVASLPQQ